MIRAAAKAVLCMCRSALAIAVRMLLGDGNERKGLKHLGSSKGNLLGGEEPTEAPRR